MTAIRWEAYDHTTLLGRDPHTHYVVAVIPHHHKRPGWSLTTRHATTRGLTLPDAQTLARSTAH